ncbi:hypothetical protein PROFUN_10065 [Planoprotostelium fungivorum]|uniref:Uncharacterized protein n=1 Tax=Planoprotostelium fungivorum TaxID=1890364 RepID=A0A2P6NEZ3_9EUKA|nr:hypothetical protein PROFUN_10065 [Planoprotostelium fungivorum]
MYSLYIPTGNYCENMELHIHVDVHSCVEIEEISMWAVRTLTSCMMHKRVQHNWDISVNDFLMVLHWLKSYPTWDAGVVTESFRDISVFEKHNFLKETFTGYFHRDLEETSRYEKACFEQLINHFSSLPNRKQPDSRLFLPLFHSLVVHVTTAGAAEHKLLTNTY